MFLSHVTIGFEKLNALLGLPEDTSVVAVKETEEGNMLLIKICSQKRPEKMVIDPQDSLEKIGKAFYVTNPENQQEEVGKPS